MKTVRQLIHGQENQIWSVSPDDSVHDAVALLVEKDIGALLVINQNKLVGVVSERDCTRKTLLNKLSAFDTTVESIMTSRVAYAKLSHTVNECMALMTEKRIRHLPIMDGDNIVCMISLGDLVKEVIAEQQTLIDHLEHYISG
jgi:CBS domain-containing protein|tara:strand:- start:757 stop:1185 length:429 start_codon:yes stop_codon:yes gene_type:complete